MAVDELDGLLVQARAEAEERTRQAPARPGASRNPADFDRPRHPGPAGGGPGRRPAR